MAKLKIKDERGKEWVHELVDDVTPIGRASTNTIQVVDGKASRQHFRVEKAGAFFKVVDLGSTNGTRLNGIRIQGEAFLKAGDQLSFGKTTFDYDGPSKEEDSLTKNPTGGETIEIDPISLEPTADAPKYVLKVKEGNQAGKSFELGVKALTLGRHPANTVQVLDDAASNYHAEVNREPIGFVLTDLGSTNGTRVKVKGKTDFEKVVKTPLSAGMQIRIGKTLLEFENIGKPEDDQALFGTVALDPAKLEEKLADPKRRSKTPWLAIVGLLLLAAVGGGLFYLSKLPPAVVVIPPPPADTTNKISNGDFSLGTDEEGNPRNFRVLREVPGIKVSVLPEADRGGGEKPDGKKMGLQISKTGAKSASTRTVVETSDTLQVQPGKAYEFAGWMKNSGDGLYGLRVTWIKGETSFSEDPVVLKDTQEWKKLSATVAPPPWAERARVGVFVQGKDGTAWFDDLAFREDPNEKNAAPSYPTVKFAGIAVDFEGTKGAFSARLQNEVVLTDATLLLVSPDESAVCELSSAIKPQVTKDASKVSFDGRMYDFALQELTNYLIRAQPGAAGVDIRVAMDRRTETGSSPQLRCYIVGPAAQGEVEISSGGEPERLPPTKDKSFKGIQGLLFNVGKSPQFNLGFDKPADVDLKRRGERWEVTVKFKGDLEISLSPENMAQKQKMIAAVAELKKTMEAGNWGDAEMKTAALLAAFGDRFPEAKDESDKAQQKIGDQWKNVQDDITRALNSLKAAITPETLKLATQSVSRHMAVWAGSEKRTAELKDNLDRIEGMRLAGVNSKAEEEADRLLQKAQLQMNSKVYSIAIAILKTSILEDKVYSKTKAAEKAKELLPVAEAAEQKKKEINSIQDRLREKSKNFLLARDYKGAIDAIEKDNEFQANKADLQEINELLNEWHKK